MVSLGLLTVTNSFTYSITANNCLIALSSSVLAVFSISVINLVTIHLSNWFLLTLSSLSELQTCTNSSIFTAVALSVRILFKTTVLPLYLSNSVLLLNILIVSLNFTLINNKMVKNKKLTIHSKILQSVYTCIHYPEISTLYIQPTKIVIGNLIFVVGGNLYNFHLQLIFTLFFNQIIFYRA